MEVGRVLWHTNGVEGTPKLNATLSHNPLVPGGERPMRDLARDETVNQQNGKVSLPKNHKRFPSPPV